MDTNKQQHLRNLAAGVPVLVVEDEPDFRNQITQRLTALDLVVTTAKDGWEGLLAFDRGQFSLVVTDFSMPGKTGIEMTREIRQKSSAHVIILTSFSKQDVVRAIFSNDEKVYLVDKGGMERSVVGLEDALFMALARIDNARKKSYLADLPTKTEAVSADPPAKPYQSIILPGSALARLREMNERK